MALNVGEVTATANIDSTNFNKGIDNMSDRVGKFKGFAKAAFAGVATAIAGVGAAGAVMVGAVSDAADYAYEIKKASKATETSYQNMQELRYAFTKVGLDPDETSEVLMEMNRTMGEAITKGGDMKQRYKALGFEMKNLKDMSAAEGFMKVVKGLSQMEDRGRATLIAGKLFGEDIQKNLGHLIYGWDKLKNLRGESRDAEVIMSDEEIESAAQFNQTIERLKQSAKGLWREFGKIALPYLKDFADVLIKNLPKIFDALEDFHAWIDKSGSLNNMLKNLTEMAGLGGMENLAKAGDNLAQFFTTFWDVLGPTLQSMLPLLKSTFQLMVDLLAGDWEAAGEDYIQVWKEMGSVIGTVFEEIMEHTKLDRFIDMWKTGLNGLIIALNHMPGIDLELIYPDFAEAKEDIGLGLQRTAQDEKVSKTMARYVNTGGLAFQQGLLGTKTQQMIDRMVADVADAWEKGQWDMPALDPSRIFPKGISGAGLIEWFYPDLEGKLADVSPGDQTVNVGIAKGATFEAPGVTQADLTMLAKRLRREFKDWLREAGDTNRGGI